MFPRIIGILKRNYSDQLEEEEDEIFLRERRAIYNSALKHILNKNKKKSGSQIRYILVTNPAYNSRNMQDCSLSALNYFIQNDYIVVKTRPIYIVLG
jgi:hypothetical protein